MISLSDVLICCLVGVGIPAADASDGLGQCQCDSLQNPSFAIYALSKGRGVPDDTYSAYTGVRQYLQNLQEQGHVLQLTETRIGLEGERRLCVAFSNSTTAHNACETVCQRTRHLQLINIRNESCTPQTAGGTSDSG